MKIPPLVPLSVLLTVLACPPEATAQAGGIGAAASPAEVVTDLRFTPAPEAVVNSLRDELRIFTRVIERSVRRTETDRPAAFRMGIPLLLSREAPAVHCTWIEGFGALLSLEVDMPLVPPTTNAPTVASGNPDSDWEAARRELAGDSTHSGGPDPAAHDPARLVQLRDRLIAALRQATNLHHVAASDVVAITVRGPASASSGAGGRASFRSSARYGSVSVSSGFVGSDSGGGGVSFGTGGDPLVDPQTGAPLTRARSFGSYGGWSGFGDESTEASYLNLRVRKTDLDALAAGTLSGDAFAAKVGTHSYQGPRPAGTPAVPVF